MKFLSFLGSALFILCFLALAMPKALLPYAVAKATKKTSSKNPVNYRKISSEDINNQLRERLSNLSKLCDNNTNVSLSQKILLFERHLDQTKQFILDLKANSYLSFEDRLLLNSILMHTQDLPYKAVIKENIEPHRKASVLKSNFEHNYRYAYNIDETKKVFFSWWAQIIFDSLSCMAEKPNVTGNNNKYKQSGKRNK